MVLLWRTHSHAILTLPPSSSTLSHTCVPILHSHPHRLNSHAFTRSQSADFLFRAKPKTSSLVPQPKVRYVYAQVPCCPLFIAPVQTMLPQAKSVNVVANALHKTPTEADITSFNAWLHPASTTPTLFPSHQSLTHSSLFSAGTDDTALPMVH